MTPAPLPRINLDEVSMPAGEVTIKGEVYLVSHVTSASWDGAKKLQDDERRRQEGEKVVPDVAVIFRIAKSLLPNMPEAVKDHLTIEQATAVLQVATHQADQVETLFPKAKGPASRRKGSSPTRR